MYFLLADNRANSQTVQTVYNTRIICNLRFLSYTFFELRLVYENHVSKKKLSINCDLSDCIICNMLQVKKQTNKRLR